MLTTRNLTININHKLILSDISLDFKEGKRTAIIGPNGCGKSTLLIITISFRVIFFWTDKI